MKDRKNLIIIAVIMAIVATSMFLVVDITAVFLIAYVFALIGIAGVLICATQMLDKRETYPWSSAIPIQALTYLIIEVIFSAGVVVLQELEILNLSPGLFLVFHIVVAGFFAIRIMMMRGGSEHIETVGEKTEAKISVFKELRNETEILVRETQDEEVRETVKKFAEAVRYSDPVTNENMIETDKELLAKVQNLHNVLVDKEKLKKEIQQLEKLLEQRNIKAKMSK